MSQDMEAVLASVRLGDVFFLPEGTVCKVSSGATVMVSGSVVVDLGSVTCVMVGPEVRRYGWAPDVWVLHESVSQNGLDTWCLDDVLDILELPPYAPPFEEWPKGIKHNLEAINAAIRLGDAAKPPNGSTVELSRSHYPDLPDPIVFVHEDSSLQAHDRYEVYNIYGSRKCACSGSLSLIERILCLPLDAPPFEKWERP